MKIDKSAAIITLLLLVVPFATAGECLLGKYVPQGADWIGQDVAIANNIFAFSASASDEIFVGKRKSDGSGIARRRLSGFDYITDLEMNGNLLVASSNAGDAVYLIDTADNLSVQSVPYYHPTSAYTRHGLLVIGSAYHDNPGGHANGVVSIYRKIDGVWTFQAEIQNEDNHDFDIFGYKVVIHPSGRIYVGAIGAQTNGVRVGAVYEFTRLGGRWTETEKITYGLSDMDFFGHDIALTPNGQSMLVSAPGRQTVFALDEHGDYWSYNSGFAIAGSNTEFGDSIAVNDRFLVVGAPYDNNDEGAVHVYAYDGINWSDYLTIKAPVGYAVDEFGRSVAISNSDKLLIGAPLHPNEMGPGAVYLYNLACK